MLFTVKLRDRVPQSRRGRSKQYQRVLEGVMVEVIFEAILKVGVGTPRGEKNVHGTQKTF